MKRKFYLLTFLCWFASLAYAQAQPLQTDSCNAAFSYAIGGSNSVTFFAADSLAGPQTVSQWYFGDGTSGIGQIVSHVYGAPGTYSVHHIVTDSAIHCQDSSVQTVTIAAQPSCTVSINSVLDSPNLYRYTFTAVPGGASDSAVTYSWKINDTTVSTQQSFTYNFPAPGVYNVCVYSTSSQGCQASQCVSITIADTVQCFPGGVSFAYTMDSSNHRTFRFVPSPNDSSYHYYWSFGDGSASTLRTPPHTYAAPGAYVVSLTISKPGRDSCNGSAQQTVYVPGDTARCSLDSISFYYTVDSSNQLDIHFTPRPDSANYNYFWSFGDGSASTMPTPSHTYAQASVYQVSLTVTSTNPPVGSDTCRATTTQYVTVGSQPVTCSVSFTYSVDSANAKTISFTAHPVPDSAVTQHWTFTSTKDSINLFTNNPTYTFADTGTYNVALEAATAGGCTSFANGVIHVGGGSVTIPPDSTGHGDSTITIPPDSTGHGDSTITIPPDSTGHGDSTVCADSTGRKDTTQALRLVVYPNPVSSTLTINVTLKAPAPLTITLYSTLGTVVGRVQSSGVQGVNQFTIPVQNLPHGIYFVYLRSGGATSQSRFQKQ